ncbi:MAG: 2-oxoacid:acceptor oxidoreductase subunit alpha [Candidatus Cloacimonadales bacterium]
MIEELNIRITGEAGQGMNTIGAVISKMYKEAGFHIFSHLDFMSRVRGGNNYYQIRISNRAVSSPREQVDILIPLTANALKLHTNSLNEHGLAIVDKEKFKISDCSSFLCINFYEIANKAGGNDLYINSVCTGILAALTGIKLKAVSAIISDIFADKGEKIVQNNLEAAAIGFASAREKEGFDKFKLPKSSTSPNYLLDGKTAIGLGAISAGCKFYTAYPMSPSTGVMNTIASYMEKFGIIVEQAEDEIAAVNMAIGAGAAGVRAMTATSGGGFALMGEGISLAAMTETPLIVGNIQRPGPATGFPTRTEQADLNLVLAAGHGEFAKVIFAPGSIEESFYLTKKSFNLADKYQIPVIILSDQFLVDSIRNIDKFDLEREAIERNLLSAKAAKELKEYQRYKLTASGISPRAVYSQIDDLIYLDSDEHTEEGHITEDGELRVKMVNKRFQKKLAALVDEYVEPTTYNLEAAEIVFFCFGSLLGPLRESLQELNNPKLAMIHLSQVWPLNAEKIERLVQQKKRIFSVENNAEGQLAKLLKRETAIRVEGSILKYDGRPFTLEGLIRQINNAISA